MTYSASRLETYEQCPRKYKFRYIENLRLATEGIEAFLGKRAHEALEKLYRDLKLTKIDALEDVLSYFEFQWEKNWHSDIQIVRPGMTPGHYFRLGQQCLTDYYKTYHPFNQGKTIGLEERVEIKLQDSDKIYSAQGYIDRLVWVPETQTYEIHDYKTGGSLPTQEKIDQDRQLALYQLGLMQRWPDAQNVKLVWHYLAANKELSSTRTAADLKTLEREVIGLIHQIEKEENWEVRVSSLCDWCEFKEICPAWRHPLRVESLPPNAYASDTGVQLVQKYAELQTQKEDLLAHVRALEEEQKKIEEAARAYAEKEHLTTIDGPGYQLRIAEEEEWKTPRKNEDPLAWELLRTTLKNAGKLEEVSTVNANMLRFAIRRGKWPEDLVKSITSLVNRAARKVVALVKKR